MTLLAKPALAGSKQSVKLASRNPHRKSIKMFKRVGIFTKNDGPAVAETFNTTITVLKKRGCEVFLCGDIPKGISRAGSTFLEQHEVAQSCDLIISVGGDGTLLICARLIYPQDVALMGINLGRLGFLTDLQPDRIETELNSILKGAFETEKRGVLGYEVIRSGEKIVSGDALNDVVVSKWNTARLITLNTYVNGKFLHSQRSDGMLVATPTGSTAYALSGGGPILDPDVAALVLVPICPHTLTNRPIVVKDTACIEILVATDRQNESRIMCDGNSILDLNPDDRVKVFRRSQSIRLIHPANHDHFATLRAKLNWGQNPC